MGSIFSTPEAAIAVINASSVAISAILSAWNSNAEEIPQVPADNAENVRLNEEIGRLNTQIKELRKIAQNEVDEYENIRTYVNKRNFVIGVNNGKVAVVGPKGAGKSTFLWMCGSAEKPKKTRGDGTVEINMSRNTKFCDTIGVDFSFHMIMKLMAVFVANDMFPDTLIVCCNDHQVDQAISVFALLGVSRFYLVCVNPIVALTDKAHPDAFNTDVYESVRGTHPSIIPADISTKFNLIDSFRELKKIFPNYAVRLDSFERFRRSHGVQDVTRYWICKYIYELRNRYNNNALSMLNDVGI